MSSPKSKPKCLPRTIEGATARYLYSYTSKFRGDDADKDRLKSYAEAKIFALRKKAPLFYEQKLPKLVNQAASSLLIIDTQKQEGVIKFNDTHAQFLRVLDELKKTQPAGDVDFQIELDRAKQKDELRKEHLRLREKVDKLEAMEFSNDELGDDNPESSYIKTLDELERSKKELMRVATLLVKVEGEPLEDELNFKLEIPEKGGLTLKRLNDDELSQLEQLIEQFYLEHKCVRKAIYVNMPNQPTHIEKIIAQLNLNPAKFSPEDLGKLAQDALESYARFFRKRENEKRLEYHESLLKNNYLMPKEGIIIEDPERVPDDIKKRLEESMATSDRTMAEVIEKFTPKDVNEDVSHDATGDVVESSDEDEPEDSYVQQNDWLFARVKEEPRDDYEDDGASDDEMIVDASLAQDLERDIGPGAISEAPPQREVLAIENPQPTPSPSRSRSMSPPVEVDQPMSIGLLTEPAPAAEPESSSQDSNEGELEMLGTVEPPAVKVIDVITISDDDE